MAHSLYMYRIFYREDLSSLILVLFSVSNVRETEKSAEYTASCCQNSAERKNNHNRHGITTIMPKENQAPIKKLCKHQFEECSDLPRLTRIGIFSCSACDIWRERVHSKGHRSLPRRDFLSDRHQCRRPKLNM
jgi:hypothetical protein